MAVALMVALAACTAEATPSPKPACPTGAPTSTSAQASLQGAEIATVMLSGAVEGEFVIDLHADEAPIASANFVELARCGFYDGIKFHRVLAGFVIQAGDPGTRDHEGDFEGIGSGNPGYQFPVEPVHDDLDYDPYSVSMAADPLGNTGSQFFIAVADLTGGRLSRDYPIFGQVTEGTDIVDAVAAVPINDPRIGVPEAPVTIESITIGEASAEE
jgi:peptidyl-prolyl cis-trans isomerase B (cyclophilin B)